jgi:hypothetical protein
MKTRRDTKVEAGKHLEIRDRITKLTAELIAADREWGAMSGRVNELVRDMPGADPSRDMPERH